MGREYHKETRAKLCRGGGNKSNQRNLKVSTTGRSQVLECERLTWECLDAKKGCSAENATEVLSEGSTGKVLE
jgi:hypothetical protein